MAPPMMRHQGLPLRISNLEKVYPPGHNDPQFQIDWLKKQQQFMQEKTKKDPNGEMIKGPIGPGGPMMGSGRMNIPGGGSIDNLDSYLDKLANIYTNVGKLIMELLKFQGAQECKDYKYLDEMFNQSLVALECCKKKVTINEDDHLEDTETDTKLIKPWFDGLEEEKKTSESENDYFLISNDNSSESKSSDLIEEIDYFLASSDTDTISDDTSIYEPSSSESKSNDLIEDDKFLEEKTKKSESETETAETDYSSISSDTSSDDGSSIYETEISESEVNDLIDDSKKPLHFMINEEVLQGTYRGKQMPAAPPRVPLPKYLTSSEPIPEPLGSNYINIKR